MRLACKGISPNDRLAQPSCSGRDGKPSNVIHKLKYRPFGGGATKVRAFQGELRLAPLAPTAQGLRRGLGFGVVQPIGLLQEIDGPARGAQGVIVDARTHCR